MSIIKVRSIQHDEAITDAIQLDSAGNVTLPTSLTVDGTNIGTSVSSLNSNMSSIQNVIKSDRISVRTGTADPSNPVDGDMYLNTSTYQLKVYTNGKWGEINVAPEATFEWKLPTNPSYVSGTLSNNNTVFTAESNITRSYSGVCVNWVFESDFEVIASWQHDYIGAGIAYGPNASLSDFTGESTSDSAGNYWGSIGVTGLNPTGNYSYHGQYHAPITGQGGSTSGTKQYFRMSRSGNTLSAEYSTTSASGPWSYFNSISTVNINSTDKCIVGFGEASGTENDPLRLLSITGY